jgi:hypothetical protein
MCIIFGNFGKYVLTLLQFPEFLPMELKLGFAWPRSITDIRSKPWLQQMLSNTFFNWLAKQE